MTENSWIIKIILTFIKSLSLLYFPSYLKHQTYVQRHFTKPKCQAEVKLLRPLFDSDSLSNIIFADDPGTARGHNDIVITLLVMFVLWNHLHSLFADMGATDNNYLSFYWTLDVFATQYLMTILNIILLIFYK